jgi:hydroxyethylthiazole kinase-like uncharacterized protein yjeF
MKLFSVQQIRQWDEYTLNNLPIESFALMQLASKRLFESLIQLNLLEKREQIHIFCGPGNNGGDGYQLARLLLGSGYSSVYVYMPNTQYASDSDAGRSFHQLLNEYPSVEVKHFDELPQIPANSVLIDALFGSGLNKPLKGNYANLIEGLNRAVALKIAIDVPSGMYADMQLHPITHPIFEADYTFTFQVPKLSFMLPETGGFAGRIEIVDIGLMQDYALQTNSGYYYIQKYDVQQLLRKPNKFSHKGLKGHLLTVGGSFGKMGASLLMNNAALLTGCGLVTAYIPKTGYAILQTALPECMVQVDEELYAIGNMPNANVYSACAIGPGLDTQHHTQAALIDCLKKVRNPLVLDADALNMIARYMHDGNEFAFPSNCIITPHPKEFDNLAGHSVNATERLEKLKHFAIKHQIVAILKGAHTAIALPDGVVYFNSSGTPAMATAGSGDVLTGIIGSLLAQGYTCSQAAIIGVYVHGLAGEKAASTSFTIKASFIANMIGLVLFELHE